MIETSSWLPLALKSYKKIFWNILGFSLVINLLTLAIPIYSLQVFDRVLSSGSQETLIMLSVLIIVCLFTLSILNSIRSTIMNSLSQDLDQSISPKLFELSAQYGCLSSQKIGSQLLRDFSSIKSFLMSPTLLSFFDTPWTVVFMVVLFMIHPWIGSVALIGSIFLFIFALTNDLFSRKDSEKANEISSKQLLKVEQVTGQSELLESLGITPQLSKDWQEQNQDHWHYQSKANLKMSLMSSGSKFIRLLIQVLMTGLGAYLVLQQEMTAGGLIAGSIIAGKALAPFDMAINTWKQWLSAKKSYQRLQSLLNVQVPEKNETQLGTPLGQISIQNLVWGDPTSAKAILKNINLEIEPGQHIGLVGPSGSGKTTLLKLLTGVQKPTSGFVRLDHSDMHLWQRDVIGPYLGYLPQNLQILPNTVRENICRMNPKAEDEDIIAAAQKVGAHEMILKLPQGYDTLVGPGGLPLSAGQQQMLALARAFYGPIRLLILDEPNSHLDDQGESALLNALHSAKKAKITAVIVAHKLSILPHVDKIAVIMDGSLRAFDDKAKILQKLSHKNPQEQQGESHGPS